eukprot:scaffold84400_cov53-Cyclotella_meneghiniana.AAC.1
MTLSRDYMIDDMRLSDQINSIRLRYHQNLRRNSSESATNAEQYQFAPTMRYLQGLHCTTNDLCFSSVYIHLIRQWRANFTTTVQDSLSRHRGNMWCVSSGWRKLEEKDLFEGIV